MSYMKGDLLTKTRRLVKGLALKEPLWLKPMEKAPPAVFPRSDGKVKAISLPEDVYVNKFYQKHPESKYEDPIKLNSFNPDPARIFALRVLELKEQGVKENEAMAVADMEYRSERKAKKQAYTRLRQIARIQGKKPPPNPYPSAVKEIQAEERPFVRERFFNPQMLDIVKKLKEEKAMEMQERFGVQERPGRQERFGWQQRFNGFHGQERFSDIQQKLTEVQHRFTEGQQSFGVPERNAGGQGFREQESFARQRF